MSTHRSKSRVRSLLALSVVSVFPRADAAADGRPPVAPDVSPGGSEVRGSLDKEIIRRVIGGKINEVKWCYEKELRTHPDLAGRVFVQFTIEADGHVSSSVVQSSTMNDQPAEQCIAAAVHRWEFPKPEGGGKVVVSYPFVLKSGDKRADKGEANGGLIGTQIGKAHGAGGLGLVSSGRGGGGTGEVGIGKLGTISKGGRSARPASRPPPATGK